MDLPRRETRLGADLSGSIVVDSFDWQLFRPPMTATHEQHQAQGPPAARCAVITVSDTRTVENDTGGQAVVVHLTAAGHMAVVREIVPDDPSRMRPLLEALKNRDDVDVILMTGGTGVTSRDQTYETVSGLLDKP